jgi:hypothetical protein
MDATFEKRLCQWGRLVVGVWLLLNLAMSTGCKLQNEDSDSDVKLLNWGRTEAELNLWALHKSRWCAEKTKIKLTYSDPFSKVIRAKLLHDAVFVPTLVIDPTTGRQAVGIAALTSRKNQFAGFSFGVREYECDVNLDGPIKNWGMKYILLLAFKGESNELSVVTEEQIMNFLNSPKDQETYKIVSYRKGHKIQVVGELVLRAAVIGENGIDVIVPWLSSFSICSDLAGDDRQYSKSCTLTSFGDHFIRAPKTGQLKKIDIKNDKSFQLQTDFEFEVGPENVKLSKRLEHVRGGSKRVTPYSQIVDHADTAIVGDLGVTQSFVQDLEQAMSGESTPLRKSIPKQLLSELHIRINENRLPFISKVYAATIGVADESISQSRYTECSKNADIALASQFMDACIYSPRSIAGVNDCISRMANFQSVEGVMDCINEPDENY